MLDEIFNIKKTTQYDFRQYTYLKDPLAHLFDEWIDYYKTKFAICHVLQPESILEIGVRYGYSAISFLCASPLASYVGIDNDSMTYGGAKNAFSWAKKITKDYLADFLIMDSQQLHSLPGNYYDFVHVDGQQNGDGTFHDLELALEKSQWILLDGYFWSRENMLSATYFMEKYRSLIKHAYVIPGYAGDLLIHTKTRKNKKIFRQGITDHRDLQQEYDTHYFLHDCGGYQEYKIVSGKYLIDPRLRALYYLGDPRRNMNILDVGCGRGELAFACAQLGANVTGIDYSQSAIDICQKTYQTNLHLQFIQSDIIKFESSQQYDLIFMGDFVEHISEEMLHSVFKKMKQLLKPTGRLVIHTWPNRIAYDYQYCVRAKKARELGVYLPKNQRTSYEDLMHINEQTPARLKRLLRQYFRMVNVWVGDITTPFPLSDHHLSMKERLRKYESIFAIASENSYSLDEIKTSMQQNLLVPEDLENVKIIDAKIPECMNTNMTLFIEVEVDNQSDFILKSLPPYPIYLSYHWYQNDQLVIWEGERTFLVPHLQSGMKQKYLMKIISPLVVGTYELKLTFIQEKNFWFNDKLPSSIFRKKVFIHENDG